MKNHLFADSRKPHHLIQNGLLLLVAFCIVGSIVAAGYYFHYERERLACEYSDMILNQILEIEQTKWAIRKASLGSAEEARQVLIMRLNGNFSAANVLVESADGKLTVFARNALEMLARDHKQHPEYYVIPSLAADYHEKKDSAVVEPAKRVDRHF